MAGVHGAELQLTEAGVAPSTAAALVALAVHDYAVHAALTAMVQGHWTVVQALAVLAKIQSEDANVLRANLIERGLRPVVLECPNATCAFKR